MPALGNDFVAMVKDSSLVSVLGVQDVTQLARLYAASTFLFFQTYSILAFIYLIITILLTRFVRWLERRLSRDRR
jgi:polar amino acid transport system permease protein